MRVIGGEFASIPLLTAEGLATRPTTDQVKENIFNLLGSSLVSGPVLDFYGGSGGLAIEAVSRGMPRAVITEKSPDSLAAIKKNIAKIRAPHRFKVLAGDNRRSLVKYLQGAHEEPSSFTLVFLDPPYQSADPVADILWLDQQACLHQEVILVCESDSQDSLPDQVGAFAIWKEKIYGKTRVTMYKGA